MPSTPVVADRLGEPRHTARLFHFHSLADDMVAIHILEQMYQMEVTNLSPAEVKAFRDKTRPVYDKWAGEIGIDLVRSAESIVESAK